MEIRGLWVEFTVNVSLKSIWAKEGAISRTTSRICALHFRDEDYTSSWKDVLNRRVVPRMSYDKQRKANHRANDVIVKEGESQVLVGRFMYAPLDWYTSIDDDVDIYVMRDTLEEEWIKIGCGKTDKNGRVTYTIPENEALGFGMYPIKMVLRKDGSYLILFMAVIHPNTEVVVFSIDGSFAAKMSSTGLAPQIRRGSIDVVRFWEELGYLIVYITGRPDMQQKEVESWLSQYKFPKGILSFADTLATDPLGHKAVFLRNLIKKHKVVIRAAYSNDKDIGVFSSISLEPEQIFILGNMLEKHKVMVDALGEDFIDHLAKLKSDSNICQAKTEIPKIITIKEKN